MRFITAIISFICISPFFGQDKGVWMHPNKGQWNDQILYKVDLDYGEMYVEKDQFTFALNDFKQIMSHNHHSEKESIISEKKVIQSHIIKSTFIHSSWKGNVQESEVSTFYRNYFQGNDQSKWKTKINSFQLIQMNEFYPNIDLVLDSKVDHFKYSFVIKPNTDPGIIEYEITGANSVKLSENGHLLIETIFGNIIEEKPIAWTVSSEHKNDVPINFKLNGNRVSFELPKGYNHDETLIIDPSLLFSTFSGSTADNWGMTATPDTQGNLLAGGIVFNDGGKYPATVGAYNTTTNGGDSYVFGGQIQGFDIAISKFNTTGTQLLYATYLGGASNEAPHSLVTNSNGDLFIMGVTSSNNFPTSSDAFDKSFNGGPDIIVNELYYKGADIFIAKLSNDGSQLLGSTYMGGAESDGVNIGDLEYNYGDPFRGEIIDGADGYVYISSSSRSTDFPVKNGFQTNLNGIQDGVIFKLTDDLSSLSWSTYFGGSGSETSNSIQKSTNGSLYIAGGTTSADLPISFGEDLNYDGGLSDAYLLRISTSNGQNLQGTYLGYAEYDQAYFVQLDVNNDVYVYGQTESDWAITPGKYGIPNSGQFIRRYSQDLSSTIWTTMIGAGTGNPEISPTAFLVSTCGDIYLSGWGGKVNKFNSQFAKFSTTVGFPLTIDAFQSTTNGDNFYIAVLGKDATYLKYGTYMGGANGSYNHVDGGTSRFDKSGRIYHAVCGGCGKNLNGFTTTPGVFSPQNLSSNCNLAAFKFELNISTPIIGSADSVICLPDSIKFRNSISNGNSFLWDFGDGSISKSLNPTHYYANPGKYLIKLVVQDTVFCYVKDSFYFHARVIKFLPNVVTPVNPICPNTPYQLSAIGGAKYSWSPAIYLDNPLISNPIAKIDTTTTFQVIVSDICASQTFLVKLNIYPVITSLSNDTIICENLNVQLKATGGVNYTWFPTSPDLNTFNSATVICTPTQTMQYFVEITTLNGCKKIDSVVVNLHSKALKPIISDSIICIQDPINFTNPNTSSVKFNWDFGDGLNSKLFLPNHFYLNSGNYLVKVVFIDTVFCFVKDSMMVNVKVNKFNGGLSTSPQTICRNTNFQLEAFGGTSYSWTPINYLDNAAISNPIARIDTTVIFNVFVMDECGSGNYPLLLNIFDDLHQMVDDTSICIGNNVELFATGGVNYSWTPSSSLNNSLISNPTATPNFSTNYVVTITTNNNCIIKDSSFVKVFNFPPTPVLIDTIQTCIYSSFEIIASGAERYKWSPNTTINSLSNDSVSVYPRVDITYFCDFINACGLTKDSVFVDVLIPEIVPAKDTSICPTNMAKLYAKGGLKYDWYYNLNFLGSTITSDSLIVFPSETSIYTVIGIDSNSCKDTNSMLVNIFVPIDIHTSPIVFAINGDLVELTTINTPMGSYFWSPKDYLSCDTCVKTYANPNKDFLYTIEFTDTNGCKTIDKVQIKYDGLLYVPNTFTPDSPINNIFVPKGGNIKKYELSIFNRWGNLIFTSNSIEQGWDGTYKGVKCQDGTYTWKILYTDFNQITDQIVGHVNLLR